MPRYEHDPSTVTASITVLPKDDYEFKVGRPKAFERTAKAGHQSYGIRFPLTVQGGPQNGKKTMHTIYLHSDGAAQMAKRFQMAMAGYAVNEKNEKIYDAEIAGKDWSYDTSDGSVGAAWLEYEGKHIMCDVDVEQITPEGKTEPQDSQIWGTWRPIEGAAVPA